ncbi:unnamed protein product [Rotaria sp. Silwood1]|nr:unnamed protein product [Rotaria sp. Silwood1]
MTLTDISTHSPKLTHSFSMIDDLNNKDHHRKFKRINRSIFNLFSWHRQTNILRRKNKNLDLKQNNSYLYRPSIITTTSELSRSISNKSITFASVFDELEDDYIQKNNHSNLDINTSGDNEDLVIVVENKYIDNQLNTNNSNETNEPYPFRSEIPLDSLTKLNKSYSKKKFFDHLIDYHRSKKIHHPVQLINTIDRSKSEPNLFISLSSNPTTTTTTTTTNDHYQSLKTFRQWIKSSSIGQFIQSFIKNQNRNSNTSIKKHFKKKSSRKSTISRKYSDLIY